MGGQRGRETHDVGWLDTRGGGGGGGEGGEGEERHTHGKGKRDGEMAANKTTSQYTAKHGSAQHGALQQRPPDI